MFVADVPSGNVRGLASGNNLELDEDTGMGTFTLYAPRDAGQGEVARIFVSSGDSEVALTVTFGEERLTPWPPAEGSIDDQMVDAGDLRMVGRPARSPTPICDTLTYTAESDDDGSPPPPLTT